MTIKESYKWNILKVFQDLNYVTNEVKYIIINYSPKLYKLLLYIIIVLLYTLIN